MISRFKYINYVVCNWMLQMAQELGVIEKDPDFINPYKRELHTPVVSFVC